MDRIRTLTGWATQSNNSGKTYINRDESWKCWKRNGGRAEGIGEETYVRFKSDQIVLDGTTDLFQLPGSGERKDDVVENGTEGWKVSDEERLKERKENVRSRRVFESPDIYGVDDLCATGDGAVL